MHAHTAETIKAQQRLSARDSSAAQSTQGAATPAETASETTFADRLQGSIAKYWISCVNKTRDTGACACPATPALMLVLASSSLLRLCLHGVLAHRVLA